MERPLLLSGFMGTGKTTVGREVAVSTGRPFVDLDAEVERKAGTSVADLFASRGEDAFRELEGQVLARVLAGSGPAPVVSLGGGALLVRTTRLDALDRGVVVTLEATPEEILARTRGGAGRPLLAVPDPAARIRKLLGERHLAYLECHARIPTTGRSTRDVARDVREVWERDPIAVAAGAASYAVDVGSGIVGERLAPAVQGASVALLVTDRNVEPHHGEPTEAAARATVPRTAKVVLEPGEEHKTLASLDRIWNAALAAGADRKSRFVALGGGVVCDVTGFAAATWMRGVPWVSVPTTLLAMVDASVGGKTAVDLAQAKNAVGAFWQPRAVLCDVQHLATEPFPGYRSALAEVVKTALIGDPSLLVLLEEHTDRALARDPELVREIVRRSIRVKARVVSLDEREDGIRAWLNLGHTVGHAIEAYGGYGRLRHGEAISLGLVAALRIGERLGRTDRELSERCIDLLGRLGLPVDLSAEPLSKAVGLIGHDKKRAGARLRFIVAAALGRVEMVDLELTELRGHVLSLCP